jgi:phosphate/sulfate permease
MANKDQVIGAVIAAVCVVTAVAYVAALFWPTLEAIRFWLVAVPVLIAFIAVLGIGAWIGWTMATTPLPKPIEETETEKPKKQEEQRNATA